MSAHVCTFCCVCESKSSVCTIVESISVVTNECFASRSGKGIWWKWPTQSTADGWRRELLSIVHLNVIFCAAIAVKVENCIIIKKNYEAISAFVTIPVLNWNRLESDTHPVASRVADCYYPSTVLVMSVCWVTRRCYSTRRCCKYLSTTRIRKGGRWWSWFGWRWWDQGWTRISGSCMSIIQCSS